jgi:hypothetical protein
MSRTQDLLRRYIVGLEYPEVSRFELLDLLETRSALAQVESELQGAERHQLEEADARFLELAEILHRQISAVADLVQTRHQSNIPPSHWWWYVDRLIEHHKAAIP